MKTGMKLALIGSACLAASAVNAQMGPDFDFVSPPHHTVQVNLSELQGRPGDMRLDGYYVFAHDGLITVVSHRPGASGDKFIASASLDRGRFNDLQSYNSMGHDVMNEHGRLMDWNMRTHGHYAGITFDTGRAHYLAIELGTDYSPGANLPAIFVGPNRDRYRSGSGYLVVDLTR